MMVYVAVVFPGHSERAMLYHELEDGMYSVTPYFFAKVPILHCSKSFKVTTRRQQSSMQILEIVK